VVVVHVLQADGEMNRIRMSTRTSRHYTVRSRLRFLLQVDGEMNAIQIAINNVARTILGKKRSDHINVSNLLHRAGRVWRLAAGVTE
jgi:hypothetical protein